MTCGQTGVRVEEKIEKGKRPQELRIRNGQAATSSGKPVLLRVDYAGGHGMMGATRDQADKQLADEWSFLLWQSGEPGFQPPKP